MIQSLHIFRKDVRHLWPELALYAALLITFALIAPQLWNGMGLPSGQLEMMSTLLKVLIPITWLVLIVGVIHDESPVGDQQFWVTRPYAWTSLLAAKLLFIAICIVVPFVAMQWYLLLHAGLNPLFAYSGLSISLMAIAKFNWAPFTAIAAVIATFSRVFMVVVAAFIVWIVVGIGAGDAAGPLMAPPFALEALSIFIVCAILGILIYQYSVRDTARSRIALAATLFLALGSYWCFTRMYFASPVNALVRHYYPVSSNHSAHLTFDSSSYAYADRAGRTAASRGFVGVHLPVRFEGLDPSVRLNEANASFTIDIPGYHYVSPWRPVTIDEQGFSLLIPSETFNRIHTAGVRMHLTFVGQRLLPGSPEIVTAIDRFKVPNNGSCVLHSDQRVGNIVCRYAFQSPPPTRITGSVSTPSCNRPDATNPGSANVRFMPAGSRVDPVIEESLQLGGMVCPGTQLTFVPYHPDGNLRAELDIPAITLDHYTSN